MFTSILSRTHWAVNRTAYILTVHQLIPRMCGIVWSILVIGSVQDEFYVQFGNCKKKFIYFRSSFIYMPSWVLRTLMFGFLWQSYFEIMKCKFTNNSRSRSTIHFYFGMKSILHNIYSDSLKLCVMVNYQNICYWNWKLAQIYRDVNFYAEFE